MIPQALTPVRIGVLRLADNAPVLVAQARGLAAARGVELQISVEPSWANIADKLRWGGLDAAVMLPPLALAMACGLRGPAARLLVPMGLSQGGNMIVGAPGVAAGEAGTSGDALAAGRAFAGWLRRHGGARFAVVHAFSSHNLLLRYWLAACGADPDADVETVVLPPQEVLAALRQGRIAGFCAGAPWGGEAEARGDGRMLLGSSAIWPHHPEKCLAVTEAWTAEHPGALTLLLRTLVAAQGICDDPDSAPDIASLLAERLSLPEGSTRAALPGGRASETIGFAPSLPWPSQAAWFLRQMRRWAWLGPDGDIDALARQLYRPEFLPEAAVAEGIVLPSEPPLHLFDAGLLRASN